MERPDWLSSSTDTQRVDIEADKVEGNAVDGGGRILSRKKPATAFG